MIWRHVASLNNPSCSPVVVLANAFDWRTSIQQVIFCDTGFEGGVEQSAS